MWKFLNVTGSWYYFLFVFLQIVVYRNNSIGISLEVSLPHEIKRQLCIKNDNVCVVSKAIGNSFFVLYNAHCSPWELTRMYYPKIHLSVFHSILFCLIVLAVDFNDTYWHEMTAVFTIYGSLNIKSFLSKPLVSTGCAFIHML